MKQQGAFLNLLVRTLLIASICAQALFASAQCNPNFIYGLTNAGMIQRIDVKNGNVANPINPAFTGNAANLSNGLGYNELNGKYYFFKRNINAAPQEFVSFDPATNLYTVLAPAPVATGNNLINLGCLNSTGSGYYCIDAFGTLYYYNVAFNFWITICTNIKNEAGVTLSSIIGAGILNRFYGDMAFDSAGNLWLLVSGAVDYGVFKISGPLPVYPVMNLTAAQVIAPNTPTPGGTFGGMAFSYTGTLYLASNSPNNKLYELTSVSTLSFITNLNKDGIGNDLTSCNFPLSELASTWIKLSAAVVNDNTVVLNWTILQPASTTGYAVEYSADGVTWDEIHFTYKKSDDLSATYSFSESNLPGGTNYYRIKKTDENGTVAYSSIEKVTTVSHVSINVWPNPAQDVLKLQTNETGAGTSRAFIYDEAGRMLSSLNVKSGVNNIPVQTLHKGTYIVTVKLSNGEVMNQKFVKQ